MNRMDRLSLSQFTGVHKNVNPVVEDMLKVNFMLYDTDFLDENLIRDFARPGVQKYENTVRLLRYNNPNCYVSNNNAVFQSFRFPKFDTFFNQSFNLEPNLTGCSRQVKNVHPRNEHETQETLFDQLDSFASEYTNEQTFFEKSALFDFEYICVQEKDQRHRYNKMDWETYIGFHFIISCDRTNVKTKESKQIWMACTSIQLLQFPKETVNYSAGAFETLLQCSTCV